MDSASSAGEWPSSGLDKESLSVWRRVLWIGVVSGCPGARSRRAPLQETGRGGARTDAEVGVLQPQARERRLEAEEQDGVPRGLRRECGQDPGSSSVRLAWKVTGSSSF